MVLCEHACEEHYLMASNKLTAFLVKEKKTIYTEKASISLALEFTMDISFMLLM